MTLEKGETKQAFQSITIVIIILLTLLHSDSYRPADEVRLAIEERDPIKIARSYATDGQLATTDELEVSKLYY